MTVRSTEGHKTLLKLALPAPQGSGNAADETGQTGGCEAAGRLPGASEAQDPRLAFLDIARAGGEFPERKTAQISLRSVPLLYTRQAAEPPLGGGAAFLGFGVGNGLGEPIMFA